MLNKVQRNELKFFRTVAKIISNKDTLTEKDLNKIYNCFSKFYTKMKLDELDLLRKGELFLGKYCESLNYKDLSEVLSNIKKCFYNAPDLSTPVSLVMIGSITKLALTEINGKEIFNKEMNDNGNL